jgi:hypothetical protein
LIYFKQLLLDAYLTEADDAKAQIAYEKLEAFSIGDVGSGWMTSRGFAALTRKLLTPPTIL